MNQLQTDGALRVGLTDAPEATKQDLGNPAGWQLFGPFHSENAALRWREAMAALPGCAFAPACDGWRFGFYYAPGRE